MVKIKPAKYVYRQVPALLKPPKRSVQRALPSALHIGITATFSILVFAIINVAVTYSLGPRHKWTNIINTATQMAMITVTILAVPTLGKSFTKAVQRIAGVMAGGWLFYVLYASCQAWWFLVLCLAAWAFLLVALSFLLTGQQYLSPVALITAFIVAVNFDTVDQAFTNTATKTVAISAAILVYTVAAMVLFPLTATQQVICALSDALAALHSLAEVLLISGNSKQQQPSSYNAATAADTAASDVVDATAASSPGASPAAGDVAAAAAASKPGKGKAVEYSKAELLAAEAAHHLHTVTQLLPAMRKEKYLGKMGSCRCYVPTVRDSGFDDSKVLAAMFSASQVLRALLSIMEEFGGLAVVLRPPPAQLVAASQKELVKPMAASAVAALKDLSDSLPPAGPAASAVKSSNLTAFADRLKQLISATLDSQYRHDAAANSSSDAAAGPAAVAAGPGSKWRHAAAAAVGSSAVLGSKADHIAAAFGQLLADAVTSDEAQTARWCTMLVLSRQLGKALMGLTQNLNALLPVLPGVPQRQQVPSQVVLAEGVATV